MAAGDFSAAERFEIDRAIRAAEQACRFEFSVFVGHADGEPREYAEGLTPPSSRRRTASW